MYYSVQMHHVYAETFSGLLHEASWTNSEFQSRFSVDKTKQIQSGLVQGPVPWSWISWLAR